ncbi:hypothetical protein KOR42_38160 [Thalassoglobus neptunius]|uniref:Uncharacterized protein n=1 Tax=Thalassoglobus neptunius TaxID=1938619 RepID=A0A5C5WGF8_9PLAN|nr:hypothetical protein [Thalassoglobus neptunius]TWT49864.1 hypothetical protein KOR42_38160 [Thalassoglobus neptunius]
MKILSAVAALLVVSSVAMAGGLEVGEGVGAFYVKDVTGPSAGEKLCYRCQYRNRPVVSIFAREMNDNVASLVKSVDATVGENESKKMAAFVVLLTDQPEAQESQLKDVAKSNSISKTPLTVFDGPTGPPAYKISKDAEITVMMWVDGKLKVNEELKASDLSNDKIKALVAKTETILN